MYNIYLYHIIIYTDIYDGMENPFFPSKKGKRISKGLIGYARARVCFAFSMPIPVNHVDLSYNIVFDKNNWPLVSPFLFRVFPFIKEDKVTWVMFVKRGWNYVFRCYRDGYDEITTIQRWVLMPKSNDLPNQYWYNLPVK